MLRNKKFGERLRLSFIGLVRVLRNPKYAAFGLLIAFIFSTLIFFFINSTFYWPFITSSLSFPGKIEVIWRLVEAMSIEFFTSVNGFLLLLVAVLQGVALSVLAYVIRRNRQGDRSISGQVNRSGIASVAAAIGLGCVPCGTSIVLPIVSIFISGASSAATAINLMNLILLIVALLLSIYSAYKTGGIAYMYTEADQALKETEKS